MAKLMHQALKLMKTPLEQWTDGQLKFEVASQSNIPQYIIMFDEEKVNNSLPVSREEMIKFLRSKGGYK